MKSVDIEVSKSINLIMFTCAMSSIEYVDPVLRKQADHCWMNKKHSTARKERQDTRNQARKNNIDTDAAQYQSPHQKQTFTSSFVSHVP